MRPMDNGSPTASTASRSGTVDIISRKRKRGCFTRSRGGCGNCKKQKKKCDEERPTCGRCQMFDRVCTYPDQSPRRTRSRSPTSPVEYHSEDSSPLVNPIIASNSVIDQGYPEWILEGIQDMNQEEHLATPSPSTHQPVPSQAITQVLPSIPDLAPCVTGDLGFWETFLGPFTQPVVPIISPSAPLNRINPSTALLSVPLSCDSSLWSSFVDSSLWSTRPVDRYEADEPLLEHFSTFASTTIVVRHTPTSASAFFAELAERATKENQTALMHAVLCTSATHLANFATKVNDEAKALHFAAVAAQNRAQALHLLRIASPNQEGFDEEVNAATMVILTLSGVLRGDTNVMPSFLSHTAAILKRVSTPREDTLLPAVSALHSMYTGLHAIASGKQLDVNHLFPKLDGRDVWEQRSRDVIESVLGISKDMFMLFIRVNSLVIEHDTILSALSRSKNDTELLMMQLTLHSECSTLETELNTEMHWQAKYLKGFVERTRLGHECFRLLINMMMLRDVFRQPIDHPRVRSICYKMIDALEKCALGTEIGLPYPQMIVGSEAPEDLHERYRAFYTRCTWKGSAPPRVTSEIIEEVWERRKNGQEVSWRTVLMEKGSIVIV